MTPPVSRIDERLDEWGESAVQRVTRHPVTTGISRRVALPKCSYHHVAGIVITIQGTPQTPSVPDRDKTKR
ncbi:MAG: hypothetical protein U0236_12715 [Nitrospira sp.]